MALRFFLYIDPGLGSMLLQAAVAGIAAAGIFLISFRNKIAAWFKRRKNAKSEAGVDSTDSKDESK